MLKSLRIENLVLVEVAEVDFEAGFTAITGETGAGKTALIEAIRLIVGERADASKVRKGAERARIQAVFTAPISLASLFEESGIPFPEEEDLLLVREVQNSGKGRAFAGGVQVPVGFLQKIAPFLVDFIGQHAQVHLKDDQRQREFLDLFAGVDLAPFQEAYKLEKQIGRQLDQLRKEKAEQALKMGLLSEQIEELEAADPQEGEDEALFEEYSISSNAQELLLQSEQALEGINSSRESTVRVKQLLTQIEALSPSLSNPNKMAGESLLLLEEIEIALQSFQGSLESDPNRLLYLEERLKLLDSLKKKYGKNLNERLQTLKRERADLETIDEREQKLEKTLEKAKRATNDLASALRDKREESAKVLSKTLSATLRSLNIPTAVVEIRVTPTERSLTGDEEIAFYLQANKGEQLSLVKNSSSGGELSRLLFALKLALSERSPTPTMIFDEIDANVGGQTATLIGQLLNKLSQDQQILCITHFPQVARQADHHLCVSKRENSERTEGQITSLSKTQRERELLRMLGE